ncbi:hypothetical protein B296_00035585 [Ensete ventricosum]|uniref:Uncharacterized protein n=1 Tax=Ensete ventricosum TaxID=4639 RepID=A0A426YUK3_ENSVE|nr:hypothetical protein B296_00035585 [Ensete ventricosum]
MANRLDRQLANEYPIQVDVKSKPKKVGRRRVRTRETNHHGGVKEGEAVARPTGHGRRNSEKSRERHRRTSPAPSCRIFSSKGRSKTLERSLLCVAAAAAGTTATPCTPNPESGNK